MKRGRYCPPCGRASPDFYKANRQSTDSVISPFVPQAAGRGTRLTRGALVDRACNPCSKPVCIHSRNGPAICSGDQSSCIVWRVPVPGAERPAISRAPRHRRVLLDSSHVGTQTRLAGPRIGPITSSTSDATVDGNRSRACQAICLTEPIRGL